MTLHASGIEVEADSGSRSVLSRAKESVAGGESSTMRVLPYHLPLVIARAEGPYIWDVDGNQLVDMNMAYGPLIFGHRHPIITAAIRQELDCRGTILGFPHLLSHQVAELIKKSFKSIDKLRFSSSGTEVIQTAIRLARAFTGRSKIVLFEGHYSGSAEAVFHKYHASIEELDRNGRGRPLPGTAGMGPNAPAAAHLLPWNDPDALHEYLAEHGAETAAVLMEPVMGNAGVIPPEEGYLTAVRDATRQCGAVLILDEIITGFRVARGGAQERFGVAADLTTLSKAMNGGMPASAIGGRAEILNLLADGTVFHGGVYSGNPLSLAAALAVQTEYERNGAAIYRALEEASDRLATGLKNLFAQRGIPVLVQHVGAMLSLSFLRAGGVERVRNYRELRRIAWTERYIAFQHEAQRRGVYFHPNPFEPWYLSTTHTSDVVDEVLDRLSGTVDAFDWEAG
jgi:glutamate-1-semialdehyde 2,1-aminomutase